MNKKDACAVICPRSPRKQSGRHKVSEIKMEFLNFLDEKKINKLRQDTSIKIYKCTCGLYFRIAADNKIIIIHKLEMQ